ncbi:MAG: TetR/AcrR family transcriptional regulator [Blastocatellia bacterium]
MTMVISEQPSRRERKKSTIRRRIISAGVELFSKHGIAEVTVDQIADAADVGKGTIYNYFAAKEDIVVAFIVDQEAKLQKRIPQFTAAGGSLETILTDFLLFQFRLRKPYHKFIRVYLAQMFLRTDAFLPYMVEMRKSFDPPLQAFFRGLQQRELIRADVAISDLVLTFETVHLGLTALWAVEGPPFKGTMKILRQEMKLFAEGLERKRS